MADYFQTKNSAILNPQTPYDLGTAVNPLGNVVTSKNLIIGNTVTIGNATVSSGTLVAPRVSSIVYPGSETAAKTVGGETITLNGSGFQIGATVIVNNANAGVVTFISSFQITFTAPAQSNGTYVVYVINPDGGTAIAIPGISYATAPVFNTTAGSLGTYYETANISSSNVTANVSSGDTITYSLYSGTLPTGATLNSNGVITGSSSTLTNSTTYNFTIAATDSENQVTTRAFSLQINPDVVTWSSPANNVVFTEGANNAISSITLSATSAAGYPIVYTANSLPTGLSISGATITGTPTVIANSSSLITATANTTSKYSTEIFNWVISVGNDTYFNLTTLLINGDTQGIVNTTDSSTNNLALTVNGNPQTSYFSPFLGSGYYSNYFNGSTDYLSITNTLAQYGSNNFTIECWVYPVVISGTNVLYCYGYSSTTTRSTVVYLYTGNLRFAFSPDGSTNTDSSLGAHGMSVNNWYHVAIVRNGSTVTGYVNGVALSSPASISGSVYASSSAFIIATDTNGGNFNAYISNFRSVKGTAVYTSNFTPTTSPLTAISGTSLLTCQSNRFIDNSTNNYTLTLSGSPKIQSFVPFATTANASVGSTYFSGSSGNYLSTSSSSSLSPGSGNFTMEAWIYILSFNANTGIFMIGTANSSSNAWGLYVNSGSVNFYNGSSSISSSSLSLNTWYHVAGVRSGTGSNQVALYVNGIQVATSTWTNTFSSPAPAYIGTTVYGYINNAEYFNGYICNARYVSSAVYTSNFTPPTGPLTAVANTALLTVQSPISSNNRVFVDSSSFSTNLAPITVTGTPTQGTFSPFSQTGWSNYFNGSSTLTTSSSTFAWGTGDFTVECWLYNIVSFISGGTNIAGTMASGGALFFGNTTTGIAWNAFGVGNVVTYSTQLILNTWYYITYSRKSGTGYLFVNGTLVASGSDSNNYTATSFNVGGVSGQYFTGYISNLRIVKGTAVYTSNFTPSSTPLTAITNTQLLTCQSNRFIDNSSNNLTLTLSGSPSVQAFSPFPPGVAYSATTNGGSMYFGGSDYLNLSMPITLGNTFTIEFWIYINGNTGSRQTILEGTLSGSVVWKLSTNYVYINGTNNNPTQLPAYEWLHVALVLNAGTGTLYVNGASWSSISGGTVGAIDTLYVSKEYTNTVENVYGYISNIRINKGVVYSSTFTPPTAPPTSIANTVLLLNGTNGGIVDATAKNNLITIGNVRVESNTIKYGTGALSFDGSTGIIYSPNNNLNFNTGNFTIEMWIYPTTFSGQTNTNTLIDYRPTNTNGVYILLSLLKTSGYLDLYVNSSDVITTSNAPTLNTWSHVAICRYNGATKLFLNGTQVGSTYTDTNTYSSPANRPIIGGSGYFFESYDYFTGYMDDIRITNYARYTANFTPPASTFITR